MTFSTRAPKQDDFDVWDAMFVEYCGTGGFEPSPGMRQRVWGWIHDGGAETQCLLTEKEDGTVVGFVHFHRYQETIRATDAVYLADIFVVEAARGQGAVDLMIDTVCDYAEENGCCGVNWMTRETNYRARRAYDRHASRSEYINYDLHFDRVRQLTSGD